MLKMWTETDKLPKLATVSEVVLQCHGLRDTFYVHLHDQTKISENFMNKSYH